MHTNGHEYLRRNPCRFVLPSVKIFELCGNFPERGSVSRSGSAGTTGFGLSHTLLPGRAGCGSQTSCVRQKICFERASALALPLLLKKEERAGERRHFLSVSPLSDSLPARSSRGERANPCKRFACRTQLVT